MHAFLWLYMAQFRVIRFGALQFSASYANSLYLIDNMGVFDLSEGSQILGHDPKFENPQWVRTEL
jgi:hypothetical protein